jgi:hypothetical protein
MSGRSEKKIPDKPQKQISKKFEKEVDKLVKIGYNK